MATRLDRMQQPETSINFAELSLRLASLDPAQDSGLLTAVCELLQAGLGAAFVAFYAIESGAGGLTRLACCGRTPGANPSVAIIEPLRKSGGLAFIDRPFPTQPGTSGVVEEDNRLTLGLLSPRESKSCAARYVVLATGLPVEWRSLADTRRQEMELVRAQVFQLICLYKAQQQQPRQAISKKQSRRLKDALESALREAGTIAEAVENFARLVHTQCAVSAIAVAYPGPASQSRTLLCLNEPATNVEVEALFEHLRADAQLRSLLGNVNFDNETLVYGSDCIKRASAGKRADRDAELLHYQQRSGLQAVASCFLREQASLDSELREEMLEALRLLVNFVRTEELRELVANLQSVDALTGLCNERQFYALAEREFDRATRYDLQLALILIDIDHFRDLNEAYGADAGDAVLKELARLVGENVRTTDIASRYGKERFVVLLPETSDRSAEQLAGRIRRYIENYSFFLPNSNVYVKVTASIGVSSHIDHKPASLAQFIEFADTALYFAKRNGRNQVVDYSYVLSLMIGETRNAG